MAGSLISFQLTPSHIRGISLHFLTLSYGGGCFLGAFIIQLVYFTSGGKNKFFHKQMNVTVDCDFKKHIYFHRNDTINNNVTTVMLNYR